MFFLKVLAKSRGVELTCKRRGGGRKAARFKKLATIGAVFHKRLLHCDLCSLCQFAEFDSIQGDFPNRRFVPCVITAAEVVNAERRCVIAGFSGSADGKIRILWSLDQFVS